MEYVLLKLKIKKILHTKHLSKSSITQAKASHKFFWDHVNHDLTGNLFYLT